MIEPPRVLSKPQTVGSNHLTGLVLSVVQIRAPLHRLNLVSG